MAGQPLTVELLIDGAWTLVPAYAEEGTEVLVGPATETGTRPNRVAVTLQNPDLSIDPSNILGQYYGKIGRNTPVRVRVAGTTLTYAEASAWESDTTVGFTVGPPLRGRSWTTLTAEGVLRRIGRWTDELRSAMFRQIIQYSGLLGYWPGEEAATATNIVNFAGGYTTKITGTVTLSGSDGPGGSDKCVLLGSDGAFSGSFLRAAAGGWQFCWTCKLAVLPASGTFLPLMTWRTSLGHTYVVATDNGNFKSTCTADDGTVLATILTTWGAGVNPLGWTRYRALVTVSAGTVTLQVGWYVQDGTVGFGTSATFASSSTGVLTNYQVTPHAATNGAAYAHWFATSDTSLNLVTAADPVQSFNGYIGETAANRWLRLLNEEGITRGANGSIAGSITMGRQKPGTLADLLNQCVTTEGALQYDEPTDTAMTFRARASRYGQTSVLNLVKTTHVRRLTKVIDDQDVANDVTVANTSGVQGRRVLAAGAMSVLPPPSGIGRVKATIDVNMFDDTLVDDRAAWELNRLTLNRPRYSDIVIDLLANPSLATTASNLRPGDRITLAGVEPDPVDLQIINIRHSVGDATRTVALSCAPYDLWKSGVYQDGITRWGSSSTTVGTAMTTTSTTLAVSVASFGDTWSTTATGYDITIQGERVRVTTAFSAPAGTGPYTQSATVTRSMNGVVRTHVIGEVGQLFDVRRYRY